MYGTHPQSQVTKLWGLSKTSANALIGIRADPSKIDHVCNAVMTHFYVNLVQPVFGRFDIIIIAFFPKWDRVHDFID